MAKILLESGDIMWKNAIYLFSSILVVTAVILVSGRYLDGRSEIDQVELNNQFEVEAVQETELEKAQSRNVYTKLMNNKEIKVLIIGNGIAQGGLEADEEKKWYNRLGKKIKEEYGANSTFKIITTPGGTAFGGWIDYIADSEPKEYDLVFLCFGSSDEKELNFNQTVFGTIMEGLIRNIKRAKSNTEIITIIEMRLSTKI